MLLWRNTNSQIPRRTCLIDSQDLSEWVAVAGTHQTAAKHLVTLLLCIHIDNVYLSGSEKMDYFFDNYFYKEERRKKKKQRGNDVGAVSSSKQPMKYLLIFQIGLWFLQHQTNEKLWQETYKIAPNYDVVVD